jgi:peptide/nickel transport system permease protein
VVAYIIRRIVWAAVLVVAMTFVTFVILFKIPNDPARFLVPNQNPAEYQLEAAREKLGVDDPFVVQYGCFLWRAVHLDLGYSYASVGYRDPVPVTEELRDAIPVTASLLFGGAVIWLSVAIPIGIISAVRAGSPLDRLLLFLVLLGVSSHPVVVGLFLRQTLGYELGLAPIEGYCSPFGQGGCGVVGWAHHLVLPWITISVLFAALYSRMIRVHVISELRETYVRTARAKGPTNRACSVDTSCATRSSRSSPCSAWTSGSSSAAPCSWRSSSASPASGASRSGPPRAWSASTCP